MTVQGIRGLGLYILEEIAASRADVRTSAKKQDFPPLEILFFARWGGPQSPEISRNRLAARFKKRYDRRPPCG